MNSIKLTGIQIVDTKKMKQSGRYRITLELTEDDTKVNGGALAVAEINDLLADVDITFTEIQGNNNTFEKSVVKEPKQGETFYQKFKRVCKNYSGEEYYNHLKAHLGVKHLKDLEKTYSASIVMGVLLLQEEWINSRIFEFDFADGAGLHETPAFALELWHELFDLFNSSK